MTPQTGKQIITMRIFSCISKIKDNRSMKFGQLIERFSPKFIRKMRRKGSFQASFFFQESVL